MKRVLQMIIRKYPVRRSNMTEPQPERILKEKKQGEKLYQRFDIIQRIEHLIFLISFGLLGITGLIQ